MSPLLPKHARVAVLAATLAAASCDQSANQLDSSTAAPTASSAPESDNIPRTADGRPIFNGIWQAMTSAYWDVRPHAATHSPVAELGALGAAHPGLGIVEGGEIPYQDWALERQRENFANRLELDPVGKCFMPGLPRANYMPQPMQIFQNDDFVMIVHQFAGAVRTIHMNDPGPAPAESWMGWSVGRWEGDSLVVDVTAQHPDTWFDRAGNHHSDALHVVERFTPIDRDHIQYEATIEDPNVFTRPWRVSFPLYRHIDANAQLMEFKCAEFAEEKMYGHLRKQPAE